MADIPDVLDNIDRHERLSDDNFINSYLRRHIPVIIRDSQAGTRISSLTTQDAVLDHFGDMEIEVQGNYTTTLARQRANASQAGLSGKVRNSINLMPLRKYCEVIRDEPDTDLLCVEYHTPSVIRNAMRIPSYCSAVPSCEPLVSFLFVANQGNYAHLHFDGDYRNVMLYQVFGRKRVVIVPVTAMDKITPSLHHSKLLIQNMSEDEKRHLFQYLGAYEAVLDPGEAIYFPPSIWHYVEYVDTGMSVNFRFGRPDFARKLVDANRVPFYPELHLLLAELERVTDPADRSKREAAVWAEASEVLGQEYPTSRDRHQQVQAMYRSLLQDMPVMSEPPRHVATDCAAAEAMAVERLDSPSKRWREELMLGDPL
jgi:hypothetical protein